MLSGSKVGGCRRMPKAASRPCNKAGCPSLATINGYCDKHQSARRDTEKQYDKQRGNANDRGYGHKWRKERLDYLAVNPLCVTCKTNGNIVAAVVVDHIIPHKGDEKLFWRRSNWQALCIVCHNRKTATQDM